MQSHCFFANLLMYVLSVATLSVPSRQTKHAEQSKVISVNRFWNKVSNLSDQFLKRTIIFKKSSRTKTKKVSQDKPEALWVICSALLITSTLSLASEQKDHLLQGGGATALEPKMRIMGWVRNPKTEHSRRAVFSTFLPKRFDNCSGLPPTVLSIELMVFSIKSFKPPHSISSLKLNGRSRPLPRSQLNYPSEPLWKKMLQSVSEK